MLGSKEIIIIAIIVLVLFGSAAIPKFAKSLGLAKKEFEKGLKESEESDETSSSNDASSDNNDTSKDA
tara:strand:- start:9810 stop:10013 length:204 start_codon:yes stop_codon:yes gene_type:complete